MEISDGSSIILDSSVWIAYLHEEDSQHKKALGLVGALPDTIIVPAEVLSEVAMALKNKRQENLAKGFVHTVISGDVSLLVSDENVVRQAAETFLTRTDRLSFIDTTLLVLSEKYRVITFDRNLQKAINSAQR